MKHIPDINGNAIIYSMVIANIIFFPPCIFSKQDTHNSAVYEESQMGNLSKLFQQPLLMYTYTLEKKSVQITAEFWGKMYFIILQLDSR